MRISLGHQLPATAAEQTVQRTLAWGTPRLPHASSAMVPRWTAGPTWTPPGTTLLVRHRALDGSAVTITNGRTPPPGYAIEFDLGLVHVFAQQGTLRLMTTAQGFFCTPFSGEPDAGVRALGYVEQAPLPLLEGLEQRLDPRTGQVTLVAGPADPLYETAAPLGLVGFIESYPINPREALDLRVERGLLTLVRNADDEAWRHRYAVVERSEPDAGGVALGGLWAATQPATVPLWLETDGNVGSGLLPASPGGLPALGTTLRWAGAPLGWSGRRPRTWALRASASRARHLARGLVRPDRLIGATRGRSGERTLVGHLRCEPAPGWSPLYSARHPVLGDQYLTRSELEAGDMGYRVEGMLGYVADRRAEAAHDALTHEVKWASRFGQARRYVEGPAPR